MINTPSSWHTPTDTISLSPRDVHVWRTNLEATDATVERFQRTLSADEQARAARFKFDVHRRRFIVARGVLRELLGLYLGLGSAEIEIHTTSHGKPYIKHLIGKDELCFNISHSHEMALYAFTRNLRLGVDIEYRRNIVDIDSIARHFFAPEEVEALLSLSPQLQADAFLNCWTRKEAYIKGLGEGLSHPLHSFTVTLLPNDPAKLVIDKGDPTAAERWQFTRMMPHRDYEAALAIEYRLGSPHDLHMSYWQYK